MQIFASERERILGVYLLNLILLVVLPLTGLVAMNGWGLGVAALLFFAMNCCGITVTFHRFLSHHSFKFRSKLAEYLFTLFGVLSVSGSTVGWVGVHREHHRYTDTDGDPHAGSLSFLDQQFLQYNKTRFVRRKDAWIVRDLLARPFHRFLHDYYFLVIAGYAALLYGGFGLPGVYFGFILPSVATLFAENTTNWATHRKGIHNIWWVSAILSEGWHDNHHRNPGAYTTKEQWWQFDPAGIVIGAVKAPR